MSRGVRVAIAGTGFIGAVHARSARLAGARLVGVAASSPESAPPRRGRARRRARVRHRPRNWSRRRRRRRRPHLHAQPPARAARRGRAGRRQARDPARSRSRWTRDGAQALADAAADVRAGSPPCRSSTATTPRCARRASACAPARPGPVRLIHGTYLQDWLLRPEDDNWRVEEDLGGASRAFADIGSHWCDLAEFVSGHRITRLCARTLTARARARQERGARRLPDRQRRRRGPRGRHRGRGDRAVRDRRRRGRLDGHQPDLAPVARTACGWSSTAARRRSRSARRSRRRCGSAGASTRR